jgi:hypothetical protein
MLALYNAFKGNLDKGYAFAGTNAWRAEKIISVKETIRNIMDELKEVRIRKSTLGSIVAAN